MKISIDFFNILEIPFTAWIEEDINGSVCLVLKNEKYCRIFWITLWRNLLIDDFKAQNVFNDLKNVDLDRTVIINLTDGELLYAPPSINSINYFANLKEDEYLKSDIFTINTSLFSILSIFVTSVLMLMFILVPFYDKESSLAFL